MLPNFNTFDFRFCMLFKQKSYPLYNFHDGKNLTDLAKQIWAENPRFNKHFEFTYNEFQETGALSLNA